MQAPYLFDNLWLFGALFCLWMLLFLLLLFSTYDSERLNVEGVILACIFGLVFIGFWVIITPYGSYADGVYNMGHVKYLQIAGSIPIGHPNLNYFDFPGMHILVATLGQVCGLNVFHITMAFVIFNIMLFSALLYIFYVRLLKNNYLALLCILMAVMGSIVLVEKMHIFTPGILGFSLLAALLIVLTRSENEISSPMMSKRLLMLILFTAMVISYFPTSLLFALISMGIYAVQRIAKNNGVLSTSYTIILFIIIILSWEMYWTWHSFHSLIDFLPKLTQDIFTGEFLTSAIVLVISNAGAKVPLWAIMTRYFWWVLLGIGTLVALYILIRRKNLNFEEMIGVGGLVGVILLTVAGLFGTVRGSQFARYLMYAPIFCSPILLLFLLRFGTRGKQITMLFVSLVFLCGFPTFLSSINTITTDAIYSYECVSGEFLESHSYENGKNIILYRTAPSSTSWAMYYIPDATRKGVSAEGSYNEKELRMNIPKLITDFQSEGTEREKQNIFFISEKSTNVYEHILGIPPDHIMWKELRQRLINTNLVYNNSHIQMYIPFNKGRDI